MQDGLQGEIESEVHEESEHPPVHQDERDFTQGRVLEQIQKIVLFVTLFGLDYAHGEHA